MQGYGTASYGDRLSGALRLDARTYRDVEQDTNANGQAAVTVILAAVAPVIGVAIGALLAGAGRAGGRNWLLDAVGTGVSSFIQWVIFSVVAYWVGASLFSRAETSVTPGQVLRTIGFAQAPKLFLVLGFIPILGGLVGVIVFFWFLAAAITALREAFEFDTGRAIGTGIVALIVIAIVDIVLALIFGISSALFGGLYSAVRGGI